MPQRACNLIFALSGPVFPQGLGPKRPCLVTLPFKAMLAHLSQSWLCICSLRFRSFCFPFQGHCNLKLQLAAMFCIANLTWNEDEGSQGRQDKLREIGIVDILHKLSQSADPNLCDKAKTALQQYFA
ncbi:hypothetical protein FKM82_016088 [Ascaphus truei]